MGRFGAPVFDALRLVQDDNIGPESPVDLQRIRQHLLVIDDGEEGGVECRVSGVEGSSGRFGVQASSFLPLDTRHSTLTNGRQVIRLEPLSQSAKHKLITQVSELLNLLLPLRFQRGGGDDQHPVLPQTAQQRAS